MAKKHSGKKDEGLGALEVRLTALEKLALERLEALEKLALERLILPRACVDVVNPDTEKQVIATLMRDVASGAQSLGDISTNLDKIHPRGPVVDSLRSGELRAGLAEVAARLAAVELALRAKSLDADEKIEDGHPLNKDGSQNKDVPVYTVHLDLSEAASFAMSQNDDGGVLEDVVMPEKPL